MEGDLVAEVKKIIVERLFLDVSPEEIGDEDILADRFDIDSVRLFEIIIGLEERFGITVDEADFDPARFSSAKAIAEYVRLKRGG